MQNIFDKSNYKYSPAAWSFKYIWNFPQVSTVLSGMNDFYQIDDNINTASNASPNSLSKEELNTINKLREAYSSLIKVGCTSCNYCMPCPYGVNIPANFKLYNNSNMFNDLKSYKKQYDEMKDLEHSFNCEKCGECESKCPQKIQIRKELENVSNYFG
ncbi:MAG: 4Fe-4S dicluster domain-containing protein [Christensenellaceae bacterium]|nr:4Fe-4S dicluster domain-containing protein [Christensenellaceae bacterium]